MQHIQWISAQAREASNLPSEQDSNDLPFTHSPSTQTSQSPIRPFSPSPTVASSASSYSECSIVDTGCSGESNIYSQKHLRKGLYAPRDGSSRASLLVQLSVSPTVASSSSSFSDRSTVATDLPHYANISARHFDTSNHVPRHAQDEVKDRPTNFSFSPQIVALEGSCAHVSSIAECSGYYPELAANHVGTQNRGGQPHSFPRHPRRTKANGHRPRPALVRQAVQHERPRQILVEQLVDAACHLVMLIWPDSDAVTASELPVIPLRYFVRETLRRSRTSYSTLQLTLWYLVLIKPHATQAISEQASTCRSSSSRPGGAEERANGEELPGDHLKYSREAREVFQRSSSAPSPQSLCCGRKMFLAALILASKFIQDRNFSASAWSKITGLNSHDIVINEAQFLQKIDWKLYLGEQDFVHWSCIILRCTESTSLGKSIAETWKSALFYLSIGSSLQATAHLTFLEQQVPTLLTNMVPLDGSFITRDETTPRLFERETARPEAEPSTEDPPFRSASSTAHSDVPDMPRAPGLGGNLATPSTSAASGSEYGESPIARANVPPAEASGVNRAPARPRPVRAKTLWGPAKETRPNSWEREIRAHLPMRMCASPRSLPCSLESPSIGYANRPAALPTRAISNPAFGTVTPESSPPSLPPSLNAPEPYTREVDEVSGSGTVSKFVPLAQAFEIQSSDFERAAELQHRPAKPGDGIQAAVPRSMCCKRRASRPALAERRKCARSHAGSLEALQSTRSWSDGVADNDMLS